MMSAKTLTEYCKSCEVLHAMGVLGYLNCCHAHTETSRVVRFENRSPIISNLAIISSLRKLFTKIAL